MHAPIFFFRYFILGPTFGSLEEFGGASSMGIGMHDIPMKEKIVPKLTSEAYWKLS
jgi:hypothetical protein